MTKTPKDMNKYSENDELGKEELLKWFGENSDRYAFLQHSHPHLAHYPTERDKQAYQQIKEMIQKGVKMNRRKFLGSCGLLGLTLPFSWKKMPLKDKNGITYFSESPPGGNHSLGRLIKCPKCGSFKSCTLLLYRNSNKLIYLDERCLKSNGGCGYQKIHVNE